MNHFILKSLVFYGIITGLVLILFKEVSSYGEKSLKAPEKISGNYLFQTTEPCLENQKIILNIEQSGLYLTASLKLSSKSEKPSLPIHLSGQLKGFNLSLTASKYSFLASCFPQAQTSDSDSTQLMLQGTLSQAIINGKISSVSFPNSLAFTATFVPEPKENQKLTH